MLRVLVTPVFLSAPCAPFAWFSSDPSVGFLSIQPITLWSPRFCPVLFSF